MTSVPDTDAPEPAIRTLVLTISDGVAAGTRDDASGVALATRLVTLGYAVRRGGVPDDPEVIRAAVASAIQSGSRLVVTTGGTGLGPRDRTPEALTDFLDTLIPGFGEVMRASGRKSTPLADLSRSFAGARGSTLIIALARQPSWRPGVPGRGGAAAGTCAGHPGGQDPGPSGAQRRRFRAPSLMDELMGHVPLYPLAPVLFLVAVTLFGLQMARHLRVFTRARPAVVTDRGEDRADSLVRYSILQVRMFRDPSAGLMHAAIFWGFIVLTIGTADRIAFGLVHAVLGWPIDGWPWRVTLGLQSLLLVAVLVGVGWALLRRLVVRPRRLTLSRDGLTILLFIGGVVVSELLAESFRIARYGDPDAAWAFAPERDRRGLLGRAGSRCPGRRLRRLLLAEHPAGVCLPRVPAAIQAPAHRHGLLQHHVPQARAAR